MKLNKLLCVIIILLAINTSLYAIEISVGISADVGSPIFRGDDYIGYVASLYDMGLKNGSGFSYRVGIDLMLEIMPFFAIETGFGYGSSRLRLNDMNTSDKFPLIESKDPLFDRTGFTIPLMLRGQFESGIMLLYGSIGPKFFIPTSDYVAVDYEKGGEAILPQGYIENNDFAIDLGLALGVEVRLGKSSYLGVRFNYDLNLLSPIKSIGGNEEHSFYQDNMSGSLTYRYAFNSKWNK